MRILLLVIACLWLLTSCASQELAERTQPVASLFSQHGFIQRDISTQDFTLRVWQSPALEGEEMRVYIEGDGLSWVTRYQPALNPTPLNSIVPFLAVKDTLAGNVVYLARPCQYVSLAERDCRSVYWTHARFAPEVVTAMNAAVTRLKQEARAEHLMLIGYSGGGALAVLMAAQRQDVDAIVTVAGNLDHRAWTDLHGLSPLHDSMNPPDVWQKLQGVRQLHFVGELDQNVPPAIYWAYRTFFPVKADVQMEVIKGFDHKCCWVERWPQLVRDHFN